MLLAFFVAVVAVAVVAALIYPGELSFFGTRANRWLYDVSADKYQDKWQSSAYRDTEHRRLIQGHVASCLETSGESCILDLGCGTGRGVHLVSELLKQGASYTGVDHSSSMLRQSKEWLDGEPESITSRVHLEQGELGAWTCKPGRGSFGAVLMLEVGEFLPSFITVVQRFSELVAPGGGVVMTRPAHLWWLFFVGRRQSRRALRALLHSAGFEQVQFVPWRYRYELVLARRTG